MSQTVIITSGESKIVKPVAYCISRSHLVAKIDWWANWLARCKILRSTGKNAQFSMSTAAIVA
jgi:hypothetical protein